MASGEKGNLYETLGVPRDADEKAIKKAYRKLARQYHPDVNPGDAAAEERFKRISEANAVLSDPEKRRNYDEFGEVSLEGGFDADAARRAREAFGARFGSGGRAEGFPGFGGQSFDFGNLEDLLGRSFGGRGRAGRLRGEDIHASMDLDFLEAARGGEKRLTITRPSASGAPVTETVTRAHRASAEAPPATSGPPSGSGPTRSSAGTAATSTWRCRSASARRSGARRSRFPHWRGGRRSRFRPVPTVAASCGCAGRASPIPEADRRATCSSPSTVQIRVPRHLSDEVEKQVDALAGFDPPDLREELFK
jgi:curved DNA-binding protein CbpA